MAAVARRWWSAPASLALGMIFFVWVTAGAASRTAAGSVPASGAARDALARGQYDRALALAAPRSAGRGAAAVEAVLVASRAELALGRIAEARRRLETATIRAPRDLVLRAALAEAADAAGDRDAVTALVDLTDEEREEARTAPSPSEGVALARLARLAGRWKPANAALRASVLAAPKLVEAHVLWGAILLEKHAVDDAEASLMAGLAIEPRQADAHALLARLRLEERYDRVGAERHLRAALEQNPRQAAALALRGQLALDAEDFGGVEAVIAQLRRTDPRAPEAAWLGATVALLADRAAEYQRERDARLAVHRQDGDFFYRVAEALVRQRRYVLAERVAREGVEVDPAHAGCRASLGTSLLRRAEDAEGTAALRAAFDRDPYDVRVYNLLELYEKVIAVRYTTYETRRFRFRIEPAERAVIQTVVAPFLERVYDAYVARYQFTPPGKVVIELYKDPAHYAVRTVGLPTLEVAAVCFGRVITSQAPSNAGHSWGLVLAHELAHVFALELSGGRVPRWFTEGLSELETTRLPPPAPSFRRQVGLLHHAALARGELPPLADLSRAFVEARDREAVTAAYVHAFSAIEFLEARSGFGALRDALVAFGRGERTSAVLGRLAGGQPRQLDQLFGAALAKRYASFDDQFLPLHGPRLPSVQEARAVGSSRNVDDVASAALTLVAAGDAARAAGVLARTAGTTPAAESALLAFARGETALAQGRTADAVAAFERLTSTGRDGYDVRVRLALAHVRQGQPGEAERHLRRAVAFAPDEVEAHALLGELLARHQGDAAAYPERFLAFKLEPHSAALGRALLEQARAAGRAADVAVIAPALILVSPGDAAVHAAYAEALVTLGRGEEARRVQEQGKAFSRTAPVR